VDRLTLLALLFIFAFAMFLHAFGAFTFGWNLSTASKLYKRYQDSRKLYLRYLLLSIILCIYPAFTILTHKPQNGEIFLIMFPVYLIFFQIINRISLRFNKRPVLMSTRYDYDSEKQNFLDMVLSGLAFMSAVFLCICLHLYIKSLG
jgi:hypothetical protein